MSVAVPCNVLYAAPDTIIIVQVGSYRYSTN